MTEPQHNESTELTVILADWLMNGLGFIERQHTAQTRSQAVAQRTTSQEEVKGFSQLSDFFVGWAKRACVLVGPQAVAQIVQRYGGGRLYIPALKNLSCDHPIVLLVGKDNAEILCREYGGIASLEIPKLHSVAIQLRNRKMRQDRANGKSIATLALNYRITERQVRNVLNKGYDNKKAGSLVYVPHICTDKLTARKDT